MSSRLNIPEEILEPKLLDGKEESLIGEYLKIVRSKLSEWLANILKSETIEFINRRGPPDENSEGHYQLTGSVIVFQMFNQQLDVV